MEGRINWCSSSSSICFFASVNSSGLSLYRGRWTGGTSSSKSILNSCPIRLGGSPIGNSSGKTLEYSLRIPLIYSGISSRCNCDEYKSDWVFPSRSSTVSVTFRTIPTNARVAGFFLNNQLICLALIMVTISSDGTFFCFARGSSIHFCPCLTVTTPRVQSMWGFSFCNQGMPRIMGFCKPGKTFAWTVPRYPLEVATRIR